MREGELWWFDDKQYHESYNESGDWRIHSWPAVRRI